MTARFQVSGNPESAYRASVAERGYFDNLIGLSRAEYGFVPRADRPRACGSQAIVHLDS